MPASFDETGRDPVKMPTYSGYTSCVTTRSLSSHPVPVIAYTNPFPPCARILFSALLHLHHSKIASLPSVLVRQPSITCCASRLQPFFFLHVSQVLLHQDTLIQGHANDPSGDSDNLVAVAVDLVTSFLGPLVTPKVQTTARDLVLTIERIGHQDPSCIFFFFFQVLSLRF